PGTTGTGIGANGCTRVTGDSSTMSCDSRPCQNGGTCIPYRGGVYCSCPGTFSGTFCEHQVANSCSSNPCQNGGVCTNIPGGYRYIDHALRTCIFLKFSLFSCFCTNEFTGQQCNQPRSM